MDEPEITIYYPRGWDEEYKRIGVISAWIEEYPEMFSAAAGVLANPPYTAVGTMENFPNYALMYLLRKYHGVQCVTYMRVATKSPKPIVAGLWTIMRQHLTDETFATLQMKLREAGFWGFQGEPDLFCWHEEAGLYFFAEAKGKDKLLDSQRRWFKVCREVIPTVDIRVYRLMAETAMRAAGSTD